MQEIEYSSHGRSPVTYAVGEENVIEHMRLEYIVFNVATGRLANGRLSYSHQPVSPPQVKEHVSARC